MYRIEPIVHKIGRDTLDGLAGSATERIVGKRHGKTGGPDARQLISGIPGIGGGAEGVGDSGSSARSNNEPGELKCGEKNQCAGPSSISSIVSARVLNLMLLNSAIEPFF